MTEIQKDSGIILNILQLYFDHDDIAYTDDTIICPSCFINYHNSDWLMSLNHSYVNNSFNVENAMMILYDLISNEIKVKLIPGSFIIQTDEDDLQSSDLIDAYDVWVYMDLYDVDEEFALIALASRLLENKLKVGMN